MYLFKYLGKPFEKRLSHYYTLCIFDCISIDLYRAFFFIRPFKFGPSSISVCVCVCQKIPKWVGLDGTMQAWHTTYTQYKYTFLKKVLCTEQLCILQVNSKQLKITEIIMNIFELWLFEITCYSSAPQTSFHYLKFNYSIWKMRWTKEKKTFEIFDGWCTAMDVWWMVANGDLYEFNDF